MMFFISFQKLTTDFNNAHLMNPVKAMTHHSASPIA